jgi:hypothetical protein
MRARLRFWVRWVRYHYTRRRYHRRMRGPLPQWDQRIPYDRQEWRAFLGAYDGPPARDPMRTRT